MSISEAYCLCGCGEKTLIAKYTNKRFGTIKNKPRKFIQGHNLRLKNPMEKQDTIEKMRKSKIGKSSWNKGLPKEQQPMYNKKQPKSFFDKMPVKFTTIELKIQKYLTELKIKFIPHKFISDIEYKYPSDIFVPEYNLIIECDGDYWHNYPNGNKRDKIRTEQMALAGYIVLRIWEWGIRSLELEDFKMMMENVKKSYERKVYVRNE